MSKIIKSKRPEYASYRFTAETDPKTLWIELIKNAVEATTGYIQNHPEITTPLDIKVRCTTLQQGLPYPNFEDTFYKNKLSFLNFGGLDVAEMNEAVQFDSSVNKTQGEDFHQGVGGRASALDWSDLAWISYKDGVAHVCVMGARTVDGERRLCYPDIPNDEDHVQECTDWVKTNAIVRGYELDHDWTEVIVLGRNGEGTAVDPTQNMATHPYGDSQPKESTGWLPQQLGEQIHKLPSSVQIKFETGTEVLVKDQGAKNKHGQRKFATNRTFTPFHESFEKRRNDKQYVTEEARKSAKHEIVKLENGDKIHYYYDPPQKMDGEGDETRPMTYTGGLVGMQQPNFGAFLWSPTDHVIDQYWGFKNPQAWQQMMMKLGIFKRKDTRHFKILYEFSDLAVKRDRHSQRLMHNDSSIKDKTRTLEFVDYLEVINSNKPEWFIEAILMLNKRAKDLVSLDKQIDEALEFYKNNEKFNHMHGTNEASNNTMESFPTPKKGVQTPTGTKKTPNKPSNRTSEKRHSNAPEVPYEKGKTQTKWRRKIDNEDLFKDVIKPIFVPVAEIDENKQWALKYTEASGNNKPVIEYVENHKLFKLIESMVADQIINSDEYAEQIKGAVEAVIQLAIAVETIVIQSQHKQGLPYDAKEQMLSNASLMKTLYRYQPLVEDAVKRAKEDINSYVKAIGDSDAKYDDYRSKVDEIAKTHPETVTKPNTDNEYGLSEDLVKAIKHEMDY